MACFSFWSNYPTTDDGEETAPLLSGRGVISDWTEQKNDALLQLKRQNKESKAQILALENELGQILQLVELSATMASSEKLQMLTKKQEACEAQLRAHYEQVRTFDQVQRDLAAQANSKMKERTAAACKLLTPQTVAMYADTVKNRTDRTQAHTEAVLKERDQAQDAQLRTALVHGLKGKSTLNSESAAVPPSPPSPPPQQKTTPPPEKEPQQQQQLA